MTLTVPDCVYTYIYIHIKISIHISLPCDMCYTAQHTNAFSRLHIESKILGIDSVKGKKTLYHFAGHKRVKNELSNKHTH